MWKLQHLTGMERSGESMSTSLCGWIYIWEIPLQEIWRQRGMPWNPREVVGLEPWPWWSLGSEPPWAQVKLSLVVSLCFLVYSFCLVSRSWKTVLLVNCLWENVLWQWKTHETVFPSDHLRILRKTLGRSFWADWSLVIISSSFSLDVAHESLTFIEYLLWTRLVGSWWFSNGYPRANQLGIYGTKDSGKKRLREVLMVSTWILISVQGIKEG